VTRRRRGANVALGRRTEFIRLFAQWTASAAPLLLAVEVDVDIETELRVGAGERIEEESLAGRFMINVEVKVGGS
jgi:hypothetical protein